MSKHTWRRVSKGRHEYVAADGRLLGDIVGGPAHYTSKWTASCDNVNGSGLFDSHDAKTLRAAKTWVEEHAR